MKKEKTYNEAVDGDEGFVPGEGYPSCDGEPCANVSDDSQDGTDTMADAAEGGDKAGAGSDLTAALAEWQDKFIRLQAEFDNYRKRTLKEKMDLDVQVAKLKVLKADHQSQKFRLQDKLLTKFPADIRETNAYIAGVKADAQLAAAHPQVQEGFCGMTIKGVTYDEKKTAGERLVLACSELPNAEEKVIGSYRGFELSLRFDTFRSEYQAILKGQRRYPVPLGTDPLGNIIRLDNSLNNFPERINSAENELATLHQQQVAAQIEVEKPFPQEEELAEKSARLAELNTQLDVDEKSHEPEQDEEEQENVSRRPSVLAALEEKSDKPEPVKPFRSYYDKDGDAR